MSTHDDYREEYTLEDYVRDNAKNPYRQLECQREALKKARKIISDYFQDDDFDANDCLKLVAIVLDDALSKKEAEPKCPECGVGVDRPKCALELDSTECPRLPLRKAWRSKEAKE